MQTICDTKHVPRTRSNANSISKMFTCEGREGTVFMTVFPICSKSIPTIFKQYLELVFVEQQENSIRTVCMHFQTILGHFQN